MTPTAEPTSQLASCRSSDGGFGIIPGAPSEPEPTALAAIALGDGDARRWLEMSQDSVGAVTFRAGTVVRDVSALAALAFSRESARERALNHVETSQAAPLPRSDEVPHDPATRGWAWTDDAFGWVEPTSWSLLALRRWRPLSSTIGDGLSLLVDRECELGGWNYGNREAFGVMLPPFAQTTAIALLALQRTQAGLVGRGLAALRRLLGAESVGALTAATAAIALRLHGDSESERLGELARRALGKMERPDAITLAWVALAGSADSTLEPLAL